MFLALIFIFKSNAFADAYKATVENHCGGLKEISTKSLNSQLEFSREEQRAILCDSLQHFSQKYIQITLKSFEADFEVSVEKCLEMISSAPVDPWGVNSLLKSCYAQFKDGHLEIDFKNLKSVFLPFRLQEIDGRVFIARTGSSTCNDSAFQVGDEVLTIGGDEVLKTRAKMRNYVMASSESATESLSLKAVTERDFFLPENGVTEVVILRDGERKTLQTHWQFYDESLSMVRGNFLLRKKFLICAQETLSSVPKGYASSDSLYPESRSISFYLDSAFKHKILELGRPKIDGGRPCYFKLSTFSFNKIYHHSGEIDFWDLVGGFFEGCAESNKDLILDLRFNTGGYVSNMESLLNLLINVQTEASINAILHSRIETEKGLFGKCRSLEKSSFENDVHTDKLLAHLCKMFSVTAKKPEGHPGHIYILASEECMSACDYMLKFLKNQKKVIIVGSESHGAMLIGSGNTKYNGGRKPYIFEAYDFAPYYYVKEEDVALSERQKVICSDDGSKCLAQFEGAGVVPHVPYKTSYEDLVSSPPGAGWRARIEDLIKTERLKQVP